MLLILKWSPKSTNHIYKITSRWRFASMYMTAEWKAIKESYSLQARVQRTEIIEWDIKANIKLFFDDKRKRDIDNYCKLLLDSLSWVCYEDDKQIQIMTIKKDYDKNNPRIEINLEKLNGLK